MEIEITGPVLQGPLLEVLTLVSTTPHALVVPQQVDHSGAFSDEQLIELWVGTKRSPHTKEAYRKDALGFLRYLGLVGKELRTTTVYDLTDWFTSLPGKVTSRVRRGSAIRSLLKFGHRTGYLTVNVGVVLDLPKVPDELAERILSEEEVRKLREVVEDHPLWRCLFLLLYATGVRIAEALALQHKHIHRIPDRGASLTIHGKGGKTRHVAVQQAVIDMIDRLWAGDTPEAEHRVFATGSGEPLDSSFVVKTLRRTAKKAGITRPVSPHWFRHAFASHALDHGCPLPVLQQSLGHANLNTTARYLHIKPGDSAGLYLKL